MSHEQILIIEDEENIAEAIAYNLKKEGYQTTIAFDGAEGLDKIRKIIPSLILLDVMLPEIDGLEICRIIKRDSHTAKIPILFLTAKSQEADKVVGLELGGDDYVTKPFSMRELLARVKAILRRGQAETTEAEIIRSGQLYIDSGKRELKIDGKKVALTVKEFDLLRILIESKGRVLNREQLLERIWGIDRSTEIETRTVDVHIGQLRRKLGSESKRLVTLKGVGYQWDWD